MERSSSSVRSSIDDYVAANLSADHIREEEIVARSGDVMLGSSLDPWSTGEIEHLQRKWLQQELMDRVAREDAASIRSMSGRIERMGSMNSGRFSNSRLSHSSRRSSVDQIPLETEFARTSGTLTSQPPECDSIMIAASSSGGLVLQKKDEKYEYLLDYVSTLAHLACFGIIGVLIRYGLEVLFGDVLSITIEGTIVYRDLPPNIVGSFFMGWVGIVMKKEIVDFSKPLAIGLSTGLMGSITTFSGWNQKMVQLFTSGDVVTALSGYLSGMLLAQMSLQVGIDSAEGLKQAIRRIQWRTVNNEAKDMPIKRVTMNTFRSSIIGLAVFAFMTVCLWMAALALLVAGVGSSQMHMLFLACIVAPPGVWARWHLARFNGQGFGTRLKWFPIGTLMANLIAASLIAILTYLQFVVTNDTGQLLLQGLDFGFLGCLSTVSTFVAEVHFMCVGRMKAKAYVYAFATLVLGLILGLFLYSTPSWVTSHVRW